MTTGYTEGVESGRIKSLKDFAMQCARSFGALIHMRDMPLDAPVFKKIEPEPHYQDSLNAAISELDRIKKLRPCEIIDGAARYNARREEFNRHDREDLTIKANRIKDMLDQVNAWQPPTIEHVGLKQFMIEQLTITQAHSELPPPPKPISDQVWLARVLEEAEYIVTGAKNNLHRHLRDVESRNAWIKALSGSLE
jgi:hypothetical protein